MISRPIISINTEEGTKFLTDLNKYKQENLGNIQIKNMKQLEKYKKYKDTTDIPEFISGILDSVKIDDKNLFDNMVIKKFSYGVYGRRAGMTLNPSKEVLFRVIIHLGTHPEVYYIEEDNKNEPIILNVGEGFLIGPMNSMSTFVIVYSDPIRARLSSHYESKVSKIRPRNYMRTTLLLDLEFVEPDNNDNEENKD